MKHLNEILSKTVNASISEDPSATSSNTNDVEIDGEVCPHCKGARFVRFARPVDHPRFGKAEPCECVFDEREEDRRNRLERLSNIGALRRFSFATLAPSGRLDEEGKWFVEALREINEQVEAPVGWIVLCGDSGSGKTHLAAAYANARIERGLPVLFTVVADLLDQLRAGYDTDDDALSYDELFEQVRSAPVLVMDDIDGISGTAWAKEKLFQIVNQRFNASLPTIFTTTKRPQELEERIATRLCDESISRVLMLHGRSGGLYGEVGGMTRERVDRSRFGNFVVSVTGLSHDEQESLQAALAAAMSFADEPKGTLTLLGAGGCGKTHLACAIANRALSQGKSVFFAIVPELLDVLRKSFDGNKAAAEHILERVKDADLLILDDLGSHGPSQWAKERLAQFVNYRTLKELPTVVTTEVQLDTLRTEFPRIASRMADPSEGSVMAILAPHYRLGRLASAQSDEPSPRKSGYSRRR